MSTNLHLVTVEIPGKQKKSHTCEEGGAPQNFFLAFIDELEKQIII